MRLELVRFRWPELTSDLIAGRFDLAMGGVTMRPERAVAGSFTRPVAVAGAVVLARERLDPGASALRLGVRLDDDGLLRRPPRDDRRELAGRAADAAGGLADALLRRPDDARYRASREQQQAREDQEDEQNVRPDALEQGRRDPVEELAERATVVAEVRGVEQRAIARRVVRAEAQRPGRQTEHQPAEEARGAGLERADRWKHRLQHEQRARAEQGHRGEVADAPKQEHEAVGQDAGDAANDREHDRLTEKLRPDLALRRPKGATETDLRAAFQDRHDNFRSDA